MSDVVVSVVESNTAVTVTEQDVAVDVTENNVVVSVSTAGIQGVPGANNDPTYVTVRNATGATLAKGTIVYISGANGNNVQVTPAIATGDSTSARTLGWLAADILNNGSGLCMVEGYLEGLNTQGFTAGAQLYLSGTVAGAFTQTKPQAPIHLVYVGIVTKVSAGDGHVFVKVQNGYELEELHNVQITNPTNAQVLAYDSATQLWKNATNTPDGVTSITATAPLTGGTITSTGSIGLDQTALSITKSQVSDFTSGTVTSASTAQQAGTAVYAVNSGTAVYATTSGTAVFANTSGTAVSISGDITKSQVSDFTSGTVTSASTAQQSGTAVFANTSGTATYATTSGTATYADTSGTAVFATNASTAVTISGSITQSQVTNLTTDLAGKANLAGGNAFTGNQTIVASGTTDRPLIIKGFSGQTANLLEARSSADVLMTRIDRNGAVSATYWGPVGTGLTGYLEWITSTPTFYSGAAATVGMIVRGFSGQSSDLFQVQNNGSANLAVISSTGTFRTAGLITAGNVTDVLGQLSVYVTAASRVGTVIRGAASQSANLLELQNSAAGLLARVESTGKIVGGQNITALGSIHSFNLITSGTNEAQLGSATLSVGTRAAGNIGAVIRGVASQLEDAIEIQDSAGTVLGGRNANAQIFTGSTAPIQTAVGAGINGVSATGTVVTFSTTNAHGLANGDRVTIAGLTPAGYNGTYIISGVSTFSFNIANTTTGTATGSGTVSVDAQTSITARSAGTIGLQVRGATSQAADLLRFVNAGGTTLSWFNAGGSLFMGGSGTLISAVSGRAAFITNDATQVPMLIRGAASQTANLMEIQSSAGTILSRFSSSGQLVTDQQTYIGSGAPGIANSRLSVTTASASVIGAVIKGASGQTANIFEIHDSTGTILTRVGNTGDVTAPAFRTTNDYIVAGQLNSGGSIRLERSTAAGAGTSNQVRLQVLTGTTGLKIVAVGPTGTVVTIADNIT